MESIFGIVIGGWIGQLEFFKRKATRNVFLNNFPKLSWQQFFQHPLKNV